MVLAVLILLPLAGEAARAHCLDVAGDCAPVSPGPAEPCHDSDFGRGVNPGCSSCIDVVVPDETIAGYSREEDDLHGPVVTLVLYSIGDFFPAMVGEITGAARCTPAWSPRSPGRLSAVLRV